MTQSSDWIHYIATYGYAAVYLLAIVEGPVITVLAAFLATEGVLHLWAVYVIALAGDMTGDLLLYGIGHWLSGVLPQAGAKEGSHPENTWRGKIRQRMDQMKPYVQERAGRLLLFGKLTHSAGFVVLLAAGASRIRLDRFLFFNLLGSLPKCAVFVIIGVFFGRFYESLGGDLRIAAAVLFVVIFCGGAGILLYRRRQARTATAP
jgi:membrane protein DedA with SNARE-associated domain